MRWMSVYWPPARGSKKRKSSSFFFFFFGIFKQSFATSAFIFNITVLYLPKKLIPVIILSPLLFRVSPLTQSTFLTVQPFPWYIRPLSSVKSDVKPHIGKKWVEELQVTGEVRLPYSYLNIRKIASWQIEWPSHSVYTEIFNRKGWRAVNGNQPLCIDTFFTLHDGCSFPHPQLKSKFKNCKSFSLTVH